MVPLIDQLDEKITILKAERDEAVRTRDEVEHQLLELLARIHRDGGQYVADYGVTQAIEGAHDRIVALHVHVDTTRGD